MKAVQVIFENSKFNYATDCNPSASNESIASYFLNNSFHVGDCEDQRETPSRVRFLHVVTSGAFEGEEGYINYNDTANPLLHLHKRNGEVLAVTKKQVLQVV